MLEKRMDDQDIVIADIKKLLKELREKELS